MAKVIISAGTVSLTVETRDTPTAEALLAALPIRSKARTWGEEVYFDTPVSVPREPDAKAVVAAWDRLETWSQLVASDLLHAEERHSALRRGHGIHTRRFLLQPHARHRDQQRAPILVQRHLD